jgi:hypothetical protein
MNSELKRRRKGQDFGCLGVESCDLTCSQLAAIIEGGTALSGVHGTGHHHPRVVHCHPRALPWAAATPFRISGITLSSEL